MKKDKNNNKKKRDRRDRNCRGYPPPRHHSTQRTPSETLLITPSPQWPFFLPTSASTSTTPPPLLSHRRRMSPTAVGATWPAEAETALERVREVGRIGDFVSSPFRRDCADLYRRVQLLTHLLDEIRDAKLSPSDSGSSSAAGLPGDAACLRALGVVLAAAKRVILDARSTIRASPVV